MIKPALWAILGAALIVGLALFFAPKVAAQQVTACTTVATLLAADRAGHRPYLVIGGWMGEQLARKHARWTGLALDDPAPTMLVQMLPSGDVAVWARRGDYACNPTRLNPSEWRGVVIDLWGQGA